MKVFGLLLCCTVAFAATLQDQSPIVQTGNGQVRGALLQTRLGKPIYSYLGLPYAEPPTGNNRFQPPVPAKPFSQIWDASKDGPVCPQPGNFHQESEDCLRLNVYTKESPSDNNPSNDRDVIVFFPPGNFWSDSASSADFGPQYLLDHEVVLVTVNYRLGSLGFLSTGDAHAPGNAGLKDQVEALRWVQKNIAKFGGNPNSVTIMGYNAGAWSVSLHLVSPMSQGLFHKAIAMSGSAVYQNSLPTNQQHLAKKQAEILGCPTDSTETMMNCLKSKPAEAFGESVPQFFEWQNEPFLIWTPVVEPAVPGIPQFLHAQPADLIRQGKINPAPLLTSVNKDEYGSLIIGATEQAQKGNNTIFNDLNTNWTKIAPISLYYERNGSRSTSISNGLKSKFIQNQPITEANVQKLANLLGDLKVGFQSHLLTKLMAQYSSKPVYNYHFVAQGSNSHAKWSNGSNYGVVHKDDLLYLFKVGGYPEISSSNAQDLKILQRYTSIITNFAQTGNPTQGSDGETANDDSSNADLSKANWQPTTKNQPQYLEFGAQLNKKNGAIKAEIMSQLEELFPLPPIGQSNDQSGSNSGSQSQPGQQSQIGQQSLLGQSQPGQTQPGQSQPGQFLPGQTQSGQSQSWPSQSGQSQSWPSQSGQSQSGQPQSGQPQSGQPQSGQPQSGQPQSRQLSEQSYGQTSGQSSGQASGQSSQ